MRERAPRAEHPNFYWLQEDDLRARQRGGSWALTIFRPTVVYGTWGHHNMNPLPALAVYAALQRAAGEPLHFPGTEAPRTVREAVDVELVARALVWAATSPAAAGGTFNLTNGDVFTWDTVWPAIAAATGHDGRRAPPDVVRAPTCPGATTSGPSSSPATASHVPSSIVELVGENCLVYADLVMAEQHAPGPILNSTIAARHAGFADCIDTEDMFVAQSPSPTGTVPPNRAAGYSACTGVAIGWLHVTISSGRATVPASCSSNVGGAAGRDVDEPRVHVPALPPHRRRGRSAGRRA